MSRVYHVDFACNDPDNGSFAGKVAMAQWGECELEAPSDFTFTDGGSFIRIHRRKFPTLGSKSWVGNWCWDRFALSRTEWKRLMRVMKANGWRCTCGPTAAYRWFNGVES